MAEITAREGCPQDFSRTVITRDIMDCAQSKPLSDRLPKKLKFLQQRLQNKGL